MSEPYPAVKEPSVYKFSAKAWSSVTATAPACVPTPPEAVLYTFIAPAAAPLSR